MPYTLKLSIGGICGIVNKGSAFEVWMVDAYDPNNLNIPNQHKPNVSSHSSRVFFTNFKTISSSNLTQVNPAYVCADARTWTAFDLRGYNGIVAVDGSEGNPMTLHALHLLSLPTITGGAGGNADSNHAASIISVALGSKAATSVYPWPLPVVFHQRTGGFVLARWVVVEVTQCVGPVKFTLASAATTITSASVEATGHDGQTLHVGLRNEDIAPSAGHQCSSGADFLAHYHILSNPAQTDYAYPDRFEGGGPGGDAQCSPVEYKP